VLIRAIVDSGTEEQLLMAKIRISKNSLFMLQQTLEANDQAQPRAGLARSLPMQGA
jgi:hypothetical protein